MPPDELLSLASPPLEDGVAMYCGTFAAIGGVRPGSPFRYELRDPVLERAIEGRYAMRELPLVS
jgi:hypothetical protein